MEHFVIRDGQRIHPVSTAFMFALVAAAKAYPDCALNKKEN
jgi:hypothetical protein